MIYLVNKCLWCDEVEIPVFSGCLLCSEKCLKEMNKQHPKSSYDLTDVYKIKRRKNDSTNRNTRK